MMAVTKGSPPGADACTPSHGVSTLAGMLVPSSPGILLDETSRAARQGQIPSVPQDIGAQGEFAELLHLEQ